MIKLTETHLEELYGEEVLASRAVHEMLKNRSHDRLVGKLASLRHSNMDKDGPSLYRIQDFIAITHVEAVSFARIHFIGRKQVPSRCILAESSDVHRVRMMCQSLPSL